MGVTGYMVGYGALGLFTRWGSLGMLGRPYSYKPLVTLLYASVGSYAGYYIYGKHQRNLAIYHERLTVARAKQDIEKAERRKAALATA